MPRITTTPSALQCLIAAALVIFALGCAASPSHRQAPAATEKIRVPSKPEPPKQSTQPTLEQRLRAEVLHWKGVPHRMGGSGRRGIDCSGFVQRIYIDLFKYHLPRSTALQANVGTPVARRHLRSGDLVFFHPPDKIRHVGIYLGKGEFAHASTSRGVTVSRLNKAYWRKAFWTARRIPVM